MFFWKKQSKRKMNLSRKIMAFVLAGVMLLSSVGMNVSAQEIVTKKSTISKNTKVDIYKAMYRAEMVREHIVYLRRQVRSIRRILLFPYMDVRYVL